MNDTLTSDETGLIFGFLLDGSGGRELSASEIDTDFGPDAVTWLHFDFTNPAARNWIEEQNGLNEIMAEALLVDDSRPRCLYDSDGVLTVLRGINLNPGSEVEDMVSIRIWINRRRIISTRRRKLLSVVQIHDELLAGNGPLDPGSFLLELIDLIGKRIGDAIEAIDNRLDLADDELQNEKQAPSRSRFGELRRQAARIRRYLAPQREALDRLSRLSNSIITPEIAAGLFEQTNWMTLFVEDLDLARERAMVAQEETLNILAHDQNSKMFLLSIVAAIFLPLAFFTGLMGMNVAGLPGTESPWSFSIVVVLMFAAAGGILWLFRRNGSE